jgi:hypothetical protein
LRTILEHRRSAVLTLAVLMLAPAAAQAARGAGHMYVTGGRSVVQLRMLTPARLTTGSITFDAKCSSGDVVVRIRRGHVSHREAGGGYGVRITGKVNAKAFTGRLESWGPGCSLSRPFTARRHY